MGIQVVWRELQAYGHDVALPRLHEHLAPLRQSHPDDSSAFGPRIRMGIDVALWILHGERKVTGAQRSLETLIFFRLCRLLTQTHLTPVFVFDGPATPHFKRGKDSERHGQGYAAYLKRQKDGIKEIIDAFGFVWIDAPGEADAELADLNRRGVLDAVLSDDGDCFLFGARVVVRNWSSTLSSSKARKAYQSRMLSPSAADDDDGDDDDSGSAGGSDQGLDALGVNRIAYFSRHEFPQGLRNEGGFLLPALLSGGDYDQAGLLNCGTKLAIELAEAGFGEQLHRGAIEHLRPAENDGTPTFRTSASSWQSFLQSWRTGMQDEMEHNRSGKLSRKRVKLARSEGMAKLLATPESLAVLLRYVMPAISQRDNLPAPPAKGVDIQRIAMLLGLQVRWRRHYTLGSMHNKLFAGYIARSMMEEDDGDDIDDTAAPKRATIPSFLQGHDNATTAKRVMATESASKEPVLLPCVLRERRHPSTGMLDEVFVQYDVAPLVEMAERGIAAAQQADPKLAVVDEAEELAAPTASTSDDGDGVGASSSPTSTAPAAASSKSPRKKRHAQYNHDQPLKVWIERAVIAASAEGRKQLARFDAEQERKRNQPKSPRKGKAAAAVRTEGHKQTTLNMFFGGTKKASTTTTAKAATAKAKPSPSKQSQSQPSIAKAPPSTPPRASSSPAKPSLLASLQAIAPCNGVRVSPSKRQPPMLSLSSDSSDADGSSALLPPPPSSPAAQRRERQQRARRSDAPRSTTSDAVAVDPSDNSVEFVSQRLRSRIRPVEVGSITVSDDDDC